MVGLSAATWNCDEMQDALTRRDVGNVLRLVQRYSGMSQGQIALTIGITAGRTNEVIRGKREISSLEVLLRVAEALQMPDQQRILLGVAPRRDGGYRAGLFGRTGEIEAAYRDQQSAASAVVEAVASAENVDILAVRGLGLLALSGGLLREAIADGMSKSLRVLMLDPQSAAARARASELAEPYEAFVRGYSVVESYLNDLSNSDCQVSFRYYNEPPIWRLIRADSVIFASSFLPSVDGHKCRHYQLRSRADGSLFFGLTETFEQLYRRATPVI